MKLPFVKPVATEPILISVTVPPYMKTRQEWAYGFAYATVVAGTEGAVMLPTGL